MLGNDVVDLKQASIDSNWQRKGYLRKIYTVQEQELILDAEQPATMLWLLWTMKEASYKVINRLTGVRNYSPLSYVCRNLVIRDTDVSGMVTAGNYSLYIKAEITEEWIHSVAVWKKELLDNLKIHYLSNSSYYPDDFNLSCAGYRLTKDNTGLPQITNLLTSVTSEASVSHHGRYTAILYPKSL